MLQSLQGSHRVYSLGTSSYSSKPLLLPWLADGLCRQALQELPQSHFHQVLCLDKRKHLPS